MDTKAGFVAVVGRPNAGKSSLLNWVINENIAMVSHKANATRKRANIIAIHENAQIIFVDTPGIHEKEKLINQFMLAEAIKAIGDCDLILFLAPVTDSLEDYNKFLEYNKKNIPHIVLLTKTDTVSNEQVLDKIQEYQKYQENFLALIPINIKKDNNRDFLLDSIIKYIPESPYLYDEDIITTSHLREIFREYIREAIFEKISDEIPYESDVKVDKVDEQQNIDKIYATIIVEKDSQKGMIIGKGGQSLKRIGMYAREKIEDLTGKKCFLSLFVSVKKGWSKDKKGLAQLGYEFDE
jgi:GTP-binding protein Era